MWMVRNGNGDYAATFIEKGIVSVGWSKAGDLASLKTREQLIARVRETWPEYKPMKAVVSGSQLDKIVNVMKSGDRVITYDPSTRIYHIGKIVGDYEFDSTSDDLLANRRRVNWGSEVDRDKLSVPTKNSLGSTLTIFEVPAKAEQEIDALLAGKQNTAA